MKKQYESPKCEIVVVNLHDSVLDEEIIVDGGSKGATTFEAKERGSFLDEEEGDFTPKTNIWEDEEEEEETENDTN